MLIPHPLVFTVRATTCVYSDVLDWVIDFTPHFTLRYRENHGPVKLNNMQSLSDIRDCVYLSYLRGCLIVRDCVYLSYLNTHKSYFGRARWGCNLVKLEGPEINFDKLRALGHPVLGALQSSDIV